MYALIGLLNKSIWSLPSPKWPPDHGDVNEIIMAHKETHIACVSNRSELQPKALISPHHALNYSERIIVYVFPKTLSLQLKNN